VDYHESRIREFRAKKNTIASQNLPVSLSAEPAWQTGQTGQTGQADTSNFLNPQPVKQPQPLPESLNLESLNLESLNLEFRILNL